MKTIVKTIVLVVMVVMSASCTSNNEDKLQDIYEINETAFHPEGIVYDSQHEKIIVGSYHKGKIATIDLLGQVEEFVNDESLVSVVGLAIDKSKNWLIVCNSDAGLSIKSDSSTIAQLAEVIVYDLTTGEKIRTTNLNPLFAGGHFINDVISDNNGTIYATDSFSPVIYKIESNGTASVLVSDSNFEVPQGAFGLNGIVYHPNNYLIVGKSFGGKLFKIPLENPSNISEIILDNSVNSLDGLELSDNNNLILVSNNFTGAQFDEAVYKISTTTNWTSGKIAATFSNFAGKFPTTATKIKNKIYVNYGYFPDLVDENTSPIQKFEIQKVTF